MGNGFIKDMVWGGWGRGEGVWVVEKGSMGRGREVGYENFEGSVLVCDGRRGGECGNRRRRGRCRERKSVRFGVGWEDRLGVGCCEV